MRKKIGVSLALVVGSAAAAWAVAGDLDGTFGTGGVVRTSSDRAMDAVVETNGKVVVGGIQSGSSNGPWLFRRFDTSGALDTTFGTGGEVALFGTDANDIVRDLVLDGSGRTVAVGAVKTTVTTGSGRKTTTSLVNLATVVRLLPGGALDTTFGTGGRVSIFVPGADASAAYATALQSDGRLVVAGKTSYRSKGSSLEAPFLTRLNADGSTDTTFGSSGYRIGTGSLMVGVLGVALQSDGKILLLSRDYGAAAKVTRFTGSGSADTTFTTIQPAGTDLLRIAADGSNRIVGIGKKTVSGGTDLFAGRWLADGAADTTFAGGTGVAIDTAANEYANTGPFLQTDGKVVFSGESTSTSGPPYSIVTVRLNSDGTRDTTFGTNGVAATFGPGTYTNMVNGGSLTSDGKLMICGGIHDGSGSSITTNWFVARYLGN